MWPAASYYDDGTVITPGGVGEVVVRRLTAAGLAQLLQSVETSGLFDRPRRFVALLSGGGGLNGYTVDVVLPGRARVRAMSAVNAAITGDAARFVRLAGVLADPVASLPASAWSDARPEPFVPTRVRVGTLIQDVADPSLPADIGDVRWPLAQPFDGLGDVINAFPGRTETERCVILDVADARAIRAALAAAGANAEDDPIKTTALRFGVDRAITFSFVDVLPDGTPGCAPAEGPAWWAPGGSIAYVRGGTGALWLQDFLNGNEQIAKGEAPAWSPEGDQIALVRPRSGSRSDLWLLDVPSGEERLLVEDVWRKAVWSPAGDALAVNRSPIDLGETWLVDSDGTGLRRLAAGGDATWSPDGRSVAIVTGSAVPMVTLVEIATGRITQLAEGTSPAWTGEARPRVAFVEWGTGQVALVDPLTRVVERLTVLEAPAAHLVRVPAPNSPGWALAFVSGGRPWVLDGIDGVARSLSAGAVVDGAISAAPDGTWYAVVGRNGAASDLYAVRADGDGWVRLTEVGDTREATWRPSP